MRAKVSRDADLPCKPTAIYPTQTPKNSIRREQMPSNIPVSPVTLEEYSAMDMAERRKVWLQISDITEAEFEAHMAEEKAREAIVPKVGSEAPDFVADVLDRQRQRTGEKVQLSALRGTPVGIIFGSYT
ncbi:hypothetical protein [Pseudorhodoplanes sp.]|uniref:hypothetical protein n=1 Tax=Pseudorhodoplanes sp. TaxID=1934341 RepID=UPI003D0BA034